MNIDAIFVLSAGYSSRMGAIGKYLPKPLWPVFEKTLLELQFDLYQWMNIKKKIINSHHNYSYIQSFLKKNLPNIHCLYEEKLLDIGGGIMNLKKNYKDLKSILISNVDQFLFLNKKIMEDSIAELFSYDVILFAVPVLKEQGYHQLTLDEESILLKIEKFPKESKFLTYSGVALINASSITCNNQPANFFSSIADPGKKKVKVVNVGEGVYYDFGTVNLYLKKINYIYHSLAQAERCLLVDFLEKCRGVFLDRIDRVLGSYHSQKRGEYNFGHLGLVFKNEGINLNFGKHSDFVMHSKIT